jgi:hypothetical protein
VSISTGLVRRISEAATGAAAGTNQIQEGTMRFMVIGMVTKESEAAVPPMAEQFAAMAISPTATGPRPIGPPARSFELVGTKAFPSGVVLGTYKAAGPLKTG